MSEGLFFDHAESVGGEYIESWLSESELEMVKRSGIPYEITIQDFEPKSPLIK